MKTCPKCGAQANELVRIDAGMRIALAEGGIAKEVPGEACTNCINEFSKMVSQGAKLRAQRKAREANQLALWRNRINVLKQGRTYLSQRLFVEAAIEFEKYVRIVEIVNDVKPGGLRPEHVKKPGQKNNEIDVFVTTLWDLVKIYDMNSSYQAKLKEKVEMLIEFSKHAPGFVKVVRKMVTYSKKAKNKEVFNDLLKRCNAPRARCFIATAAYGNPLHPDVVTLTQFRDEILDKSALGKAFIWTYYKFSPPIASLIENNQVIKPAVCTCLELLAKKIKNLLEKRN